MACYVEADVKAVKSWTPASRALRPRKMTILVEFREVFPRG